VAITAASKLTKAELDREVNAACCAKERLIHLIAIGLPFYRNFRLLSETVCFYWGSGSLIILIEYGQYLPSIILSKLLLEG